MTINSNEKVLLIWDVMKKLKILSSEVWSWGLHNKEYEIFEIMVALVLALGLHVSCSESRFKLDYFE